MGEQDIKKDLIMSWLTDQQKKTLEMFDSCESPIEEKLLFELLKTKEEIEKDDRNFLISGENCSISIKPQSVVMCGTKQYRLDIELIFKDKKTNLTHKFAIECDGHEFHEKTKEQAALDRERERKLMMYDYHVIRFTGSEIYKSAKDCAFEAFYIVEQRVKEFRHFKVIIKHRRI